MSSLGTIDPSVYTGTWTNWSHGKVLGATLTLTQGNGNFLVAFLALFVSFAGTSFFRISCFTIHHIVSTKTAQDDVYHQRQAILRNSASGTHAFFSITNMWWSHRGKGAGMKLFWRLSPLLLHTIVSVAIFAVAGIFSSRITGLTGDEVLMRRASELATRPEPDMVTLRQIGLPYEAATWAASARYGEECYLDDANKQTGNLCHDFVKPNIKRQIDRNASCPFSSEFCRPGVPSIKIDTGFLNSHSDLGLNAPEADRYQLRHTLQCHPLSTQGHSEQQNISVGEFSLPYSLYYYGPTALPESNDGPRNVNHTHIEAVETLALLKPLLPLTSVTQGYDVRVIIAPSSAAPEGVTMGWSAEPGLLRNDSDTAIVFLGSKGVRYQGQVDDPWFAAHTPWHSETVVSGNVDGSYATYKSDEAASPLGCTTSLQMCFPPFSDESKCSHPMGLIDSISFTAPLAFSSEITEAQRNMSNWVLEVFAPMLSIYNSMSYLGGEALVTGKTVSAGSQIILPEDQWQREVIHLHNTLLAKLQSMPAFYTAGPPSERLRQSGIYPQPRNEQEWSIVKNTKIRSTAHANFSILGLCVILVVGSLILLTEALLECFYVRLTWNGRDPHQYQRVEWCANGTLQLQRLAHEAAGYGPWTKCDEEIPLLVEKGDLATLDLSDPKHPVLQSRYIGFNAPRNASTFGGSSLNSDRWQKKEPDESIMPVSPTSTNTYVHERL